MLSLRWVKDDAGAEQRGYAADLKILSGDPTSSLSEFEDIQAIPVGGRPIAIAPGVFDQG